MGVGVETEVTNSDLSLVGDMEGDPGDELQVVHALEIFGLLVFALDLLAGAYAGKVFTDLKAEGMTVGNQDILIAGICLANGLPLLTRNKAHFASIKGLAIFS
jgi:predicted nucleic acid-binding protein